jgi:Domain of unknown function (DUF4340)
MSEQNLKKLVGVLAIAVAVWLVSLLFSGGSGSIAASGEISGFFDDVESASIVSLEIVGDDQEVVLEREDSGWVVNGYRADPASIDRLLGIIDELEIGDLVAANPENHERMGVSGETAISVTFGVGGDGRVLIVGDNGRRFGTAFVRLPDANEVYLLAGDLGAQVRRDEASWRDRTMAVVDSAAVARIVVERPEGAYTLVRGDSTWTVEGTELADATAVNGALAELSSLVATGFLAESDSLAALERESVTRAFDASGAMLTEITIGAGEGNRWARTSRDDYLYQVSSFRAGRVAPSREDLAGGS